MQADVAAIAVRRTGSGRRKYDGAQWSGHPTDCSGELVLARGRSAPLVLDTKAHEETRWGTHRTACGVSAGSLCWHVGGTHRTACDPSV